ncbi:MAG: hypothetical protein IPO90_16695 [Flavobacteriales bacterium]|nr:hypothetical protein [Flavobacteriales bacterium]
MRYDTSGTMTARKLWPIYHDSELGYWNNAGYWGMDDLVTIEPRLRALGIRKGDKVLFLDDGAINSALILMGNRGWTSFGIDLNAQGTVDHLIERGARYLMFTRPEWADNEHMKRYLQHPIAQIGMVRIFDLRGTPEVLTEDTIFQQGQSEPFPLQHRFDTVACTNSGSTWCFGSNEYPIDINGIQQNAGRGAPRERECALERSPEEQRRAGLRRG